MQFDSTRQINEFLYPAYWLVAPTRQFVKGGGFPRRFVALPPTCIEATDSTVVSVLAAARAFAAKNPFEVLVLPYEIGLPLPEIQNAAEYIAHHREIPHIVLEAAVRMDRFVKGEHLGKDIGDSGYISAGDQTIYRQTLRNLLSSKWNPYAMEFVQARRLQGAHRS